MTTFPASRRHAGVAVAVLIGAGALIAGTWGPRPDGLPTATVRREAFSSMLVESGTIGSAHLHVYSSTLGGPAKLIAIVPEGSTVRAGDVLARLDTSTFEHARAREQAALAQADSEVIRAREDARIEMLKAEADADASEQLVRNAEEAFANQRDGRGAADLVAAETTAAEAARTLEEARAAHDDMKPLLREGFVTRTELDRAEQALRRAADQHRLVAARLEALIKYERPSALARTSADLASARANVGRQATTVVARLRERQAALSLAVSRASEVRARLAILDDQVARGIVRAEAGGLVVYREIYFGTDRRKPAVGDEIMPAQPILAVPDMARVTVETRVREIDLHRVAGALGVRVRVDAYPDAVLPASVTLVGALAQEEPGRAGTRFFPVTVTLQQRDPRLRNGMTARVEIDVAFVADALIVPAQAVFTEGARNFVVVVEHGRTVRRPVTVAATSESMAAISGEIREGERVSLIDPAAGTPGT